LWQHGEPFTLDEVDKLFDSNGYYFDLLKGAHLVITGGEPMLQQAAIVNLFKRLAEFEREPEKIFIEVETQGTIAPQKEMYGLVRQWNISPKLSNTGLPKEKRLNLDVIRQYAGATNSCFKFPVKDLSDLFEVDQIVKETRIRRTRIYLMPICDTRGNYYVTAPKVAEWAIERGYHFGNRLHLILWDNAPGH
jgi:6-pyruvoyltetrahydropterin 2'-reductase